VYYAILLNNSILPWPDFHGRCIFVFTMSGILDSKTRALDTIITLEGRKQLSRGGIDIKYVTFSDGATFYQADIVSGSADATTRIYLETSHLPQDHVTFLSDESGRLNSDLGIIAGQINHIEIPTGTTTETSTTLTGTDLEAYFEDTLLPSQVENFQKHRAIATRDTIFDDDGFALGPNAITFVMNNEKPITNSKNFIANINHLENIFSDPRLSNVTNFKYLPPVNNNNNDPTPLGDYVPFGQTKSGPISFQDIISEHDEFAKIGYAKTINFEPSSRDNNLVMQPFEITNETLSKLDVIDFGKSYVPPSTSTSLKTSAIPGNTYHTFFIGKLFVKPETNTHTYIHLFTLIFG